MAIGGFLLNVLIPTVFGVLMGLWISKGTLPDKPKANKILLKTAVGWWCSVALCSILVGYIEFDVDGLTHVISLIYLTASILGFAIIFI